MIEMNHWQQGYKLFFHESTVGLMDYIHTYGDLFYDVCWPDIDDSSDEFYHQPTK